MIRRKNKTGVRIPREWYSLLPGQGLAFWVRVDQLRKKRGVKKKDRQGVAMVASDLLLMKGET